VSARRAGGRLAALLFLFVLVLGLASIHSEETWLHLAVGRLVAHGSALPTQDTLSYTARGVPWSAPDWLSEVLFFHAHEAAGPWGVVALKAVVLAAAFASLLALHAADPLLALCVLAVAACGSWTGFTEVPAAFDLLLLAAFMRLLRPVRVFAPWLACGVFLLEALWVNLHAGGALLGVALAAIKAFTAAFKTSRRERAGWIALVAAAVLGLLAHRDGLGAARHALGGFFSAGYGPSPGPAHLFNTYGLFLVAGAASAWWCLQEEFFLCVTAGLLLAASLLSPAWVPHYLLAAGPLVSLGLGHFLSSREPTGRRTAGAALLLVVLALAYFNGVTAGLSRLRGLTTAMTPEGALQFLEINRIQGRMFNDVGAAPYLLWRAPGLPVFADERPGVYEPSFLEDARRWFERWGALDSIYRFDYAIVENRAPGYPCRALDEDPAWVLAYFDDAALVYLRRGAGNDSVLKKASFRRLRPNRLFEPFDPASLADPKAASEVMSEIHRAIQFAPEAVGPALLKALVLDRLGQGDRASVMLRLAVGRGFWKPEHHALLGFVLESRRDLTGAMASYRRAERLAERGGERGLQAMIMERRGILHQLRGEPRRAAWCWRRAVDLDPGNASAAARLR